MTAEIDVPAGGGDGMIATMGGRLGADGVSTYSRASRSSITNMLVLAQYHWEGPDALVPGKHTVGFDYTYDGPRLWQGEGSGVLKVDGKTVATEKQANSITFLQVAD